MSDGELAGLTVLFAANIDDLASAGAQIGAIFDAVESAAATSSANMSSSVTDAAESFSSISDAASATSTTIDEDVSQINAKIDSIATNADDVAAKTESSFSGFNLGGMVTSVGMGIFALQALGNAADQAASGLLQPAIQAENTQASFTNLLGSTQAATNELGQLNDFAAKTQFKTQDIDNMAASMIAFKTPTQAIIPELSAVGDALTAVGRGTPAEMQSVVDILGKIGIQGHLTAGDITQLGAHGINALDLIAQGSGKTTKQIQDMIAQGTLPATDAINDLTKGIEHNPVYSGGMAKQSSTLSGQLSTLSSDWDQVMAAAAKPALPELETGLGKLTTILTSPSFKQFATTVGKDIVGGIVDLTTDIGKLVKAGEDTVKFFQQNQLAADLLLAGLVAIGVYAATFIPPLLISLAGWAIEMGTIAVETLIAEAPFILLGLVVGAVVFGIIEAIQHWGAIMDWIHGVGNAVAHGFQAAWGGLAGFFTGLGQAIWSGIKWGINQVIGGIDDFIGFIDSIQIHIPSIGVGPVSTPAFDWNGLGIPRIPLLSTGGSVPPGGYAIVGDPTSNELVYGGTSGLSVYSHAQTQAMLGGSGEEIHIHLYLDGQEMASFLVDPLMNKVVKYIRLQGGRMVVL